MKKKITTKQLQNAAYGLNRVFKKKKVPFKIEMKNGMIGLVLTK